MTLRIEGSTHTAEDKKAIVAALKQLDGIKYVRADMEREKGVYDYDVESEEKVDIRRAINQLCREKGWNILMLQLSDLTLEDIFLKITMGDAIPAGAEKAEKPAKDKPKFDLNVKDGALVATEVEEETKEVLEENLPADRSFEDEDKKEGGEE